MADRWIVFLVGECPEHFGPYTSQAAAESAAATWNAGHPDDPGGAHAVPLRGARELPATD